MRAPEVWRQGEPATEHTKALDALLDANSSLISRAVTYAHPRGFAVLVMPRAMFEKAARETGRKVAAELDELAIDTVVGPLPIGACLAMVMWAGLPDPVDAILYAEHAAASATEPTVLVIAVVELPAGPRVVASVVALEPIRPTTQPVNAVSTEKPRGDA